MAEKVIAGTTILDLNDDCLQAICDFLNFNTQILLAISNQRFDVVVASHKKVTATYLRIGNDWRAYWEKYFQLGGEFKKSINIACDAKVYDLIIKYCPNVVEIHYWKRSLEANDINFLKQFKSLHSLRLSRCLFEEVLIADISEYLSIDELRITGTKHMKGKYLNRFKNLKVLSLEHDRNIRRSALNSIPLDNLRTLRLKDGDKLRVDYLQRLTQNMTNLREFSFSFWRDGENTVEKFVALLEQLPHLTVLDVNLCYEEISDILKLYKSDKLEKLTVSCKIYRGASVYFKKSYCNLKELTLMNFEPLIRDFYALKHLEKIHLNPCYAAQHEIVRILESCPKLIYIRLEQNHSHIKSTVLPQAIEVLRQRKREHIPCKLYLNLVDFSHRYFDTLDYRANRGFMQFHYLRKNGPIDTVKNA